MRKLIAFALLAIAGSGSAHLASAQEHQIQGEIPFNFTAGSARLSAGEYRITYEHSGLVTFRNLDNGKSAFMFVQADRGGSDGSCKLVFAHYGDQYFLKQSACNAANANFVLPLSGREKAAVERADSQSGVDQTVVAMK